MDNDTLIWLHLSDIHFGHGKTDSDHIDQSMVCAEILRDVVEVMGQVGTPDWIFVTGDVAFKGDPGEYSLACGWLDELARTVGVGREKILITPGNHDVDRRKAMDTPRRKNAHRFLRGEPKELDDYLSDAESSEDLWEKLRAYADFARTFGPEGTALDAGHPWWIHPYTSTLGEVRILGLNTALLSIDDLDKGRIALGKRQIKSISDQDAADGNLLIVLQHHPWDWLHDGMEQRRWLGTRPHLFFCGHIHQPEGIVGMRLDGQAHVVLVAGAGQGEVGEPPSHGYAWGRLTRYGLDYLPRLWSDRHKRFQADHGNFQEHMDAQGMVHVPGDRLPPKLQAWLEEGVRPQSQVSQPPARPSNPQVEELLQDYLDSMRKKCDRPPVANIDPQSGFANTFHLSDVYEELYTKPMHLGCGESETPKLIDAIASPEYRFTVLRGGVGSGKSAFVNHLGHCLSGGGETSLVLKDSIPVVVALGGSLKILLGHMQKAQARLAWALVEQAFYQCLENTKPEVSFRDIQKRLTRDGLFMFDGLDEVPEGQARKRILEALEDFAHELAEHGQNATDASSHPPMWQAQKLNASVSFDVFLSHNSQDKPTVRELALALESCGLRVWLDEKQLVPGRPWQEALEKIIQTTGAAAVLIGKSGLGPWENPEMRACLAEFVRRELPVIPVLLPDAPKGLELPLFLQSFTWVDLRTGLDSGGLEKLVWGITGVKPEPTPGRLERGPQPSARILVTTRPHAFPASVNLARFKTLDLAPLNGEQIERFAGRWYRELQRTHYWSDRDTAAKIASLRLAVGPHSDLKELAAQPLLLTLIASLHSRLSRLPDNRVDLYEAAVTLLLSSRWHDADQTAPPPFPPSCAEPLRQGIGPIRDGLQAVAFHLHQQHSGQSADADVPMDMPYREVCGWFVEFLPKDCSAAAVAEFLEQRIGILIRNGEGLYGFPHRSFQEYLAACYLNDGGDPDTATALLNLLIPAPYWWREVFLLALGKCQKGGMTYALGILATLVSGWPSDQPADSDWRMVILVGQGLRQLLGPNATPPTHPLARSLLRDITNRLCRHVEEGRLSPRERAEAGDVLGQLGQGDPRPGVGLDVQGLPAMEWQEIPAGGFRFGEGDRQRPATVGHFLIARYPVTVAQFRAFMEGGGYAEEVFWTSEGREWRKRASRTQPAHWDNQQAFPNRPVVGVTWYEAMAFCLWLGYRTGQTIKLPTEEQWEYAAKGAPPGRRYPWGDNEWGEQRANCECSDIGHPGTVGMYPEGATPQGVFDLAGNTKEWLLSLHQEVLTRPRKERDNPESQGRRTGRGGGWSSPENTLTCTHRQPFEPSSGDPDMGFRLVKLDRS